MSVPQSLISIDRLGFNGAPLDPFLKLSKENPRPEHPLQKQLQEILKDKLDYEKNVWAEMYAVGQQLGMFISGHQLLRKLPYSAGYKIQRIANEDANTQRAVNLTQFYVWCNVAKMLRSNPDMIAKPGDDSDESLSASIGLGAVGDHYEPKFFDTDWSTREALLVLQYGNDIVRLRWSPSAKGPLVTQNIMGQQEIPGGEGAGWCADCKRDAKPAAHFTPAGIDGGALGNTGICPDCGSTSVWVERPKPRIVNVVTGQQQIRMGDFELHHLPLPACRWDLYKRPQDSSWVDYGQRVPIGALKALIGDFKFPESDQEDKGLNVLHSLAYAGLTTTGGGASSVAKSDIFRHTADLHETNLSPEDYVGVKIKAGEKTVSGMELPEGKMTDIYPDGCVMLSLNKGELLLGLWPEQHKDFITSSTWFQQGDSGAARGMVDSIEIQKRKNATDGSILTQLLSSGAPAWLYDPNVVKPAHMGYIGKPGTNIPVNLSMIPNLDITKAIKALEPGSVAGQLVDYASKHLDNMFQVGALVLDFSDYLPIDNRTATGAQIASALANSLLGPQLSSKASCHKRIMEMLSEQYPKRFPLERKFPLQGKRGKAPFIAIHGADLVHQVVWEVVQDSELPVSPFIKQQDFTNWMNGIGGPQGYSYMKKEEPELLQQSLGVFHVKLRLETFDAIEVRCRTRLDQMMKALKQGITNPQILVSSVKPPISVFESQHAQKMLWWSEWLDDDEAIEPEMMPVRYAAEVMIQTHFQMESWTSQNIASQQGQIQAEGAAPMAAAQNAGKEAPVDTSDLDAAQAEFDRRHEAQLAKDTQEADHLHEADEADKDRKAKLEIEKLKSKRPSPKPSKK